MSYRFYLHKTLLVAVALLLLLSPAAVHTQGLLNVRGELERAGTQAGVAEASDPAIVVGRAINILLSLMGLIFLVLMVYAGFLWMTARGDEEKATKAKKIITSALIGLVIVVSAYAITFLVTSRLAQ